MRGETPACSELARVLRAHALRYPRMAPCDGVKLVYQNEFGGGHLVTDPAGSLERLRAEYARTAADPDAPLWEDIGGGLVRVMLPAAAGRYPLEALNRDFAASARRHTGSMASFLEKLEVLRQLTAEGLFRFSSRTLEEYLGPYLASGCPAVSHSAEYRAAYRPAYRVVLRSCSLPLLLEELRARTADVFPVLAALDGRCASGKTTLAERLRREWGFAVAHMDHFFLRPEQRTPERYAQPGGNIDHERFLEEVLFPLSRGGDAEYRPFDCKTGRLAKSQTIKAAPVVLVEGSYACHPALWEYYHVHIFLTVPAHIQQERLLTREGEAGARMFQEKWIPLEERYFAACRLEERCGYCLEGPL